MKKIIIGIAVILVLFFGGLLTFRAFQSPKDQLQSAIANLLQEPAFHVKAVVSIKPATVQNGLRQIKINSDGDFAKNKEGINFAGNVTVVGSGPGATLTGKGEVRLVDKKLYCLISEIPPIFTNAEQLTGVWIQAGEGVSVLPESIRNNMSKVLKNQTIFQNIKTLGFERVNGGFARHIQAKLSPAGYAAFAEDLAKQSGTALPISKEQIKKNVESFGSAPLDAWIDIAGSLRRVQITLNNPENKTKTEIVLDISKGNKAKISTPQNAQKITNSVSSPTPSSIPEATK